MSLKSRLKDSFPVGLLIGGVTLVAFYGLLNSIRIRLIDYYNDPYFLKPPAVQLLCMILNVLVFRWMMINMEKEKTGKGILFITVISTFVYFLIFYRMVRGI